MSFNDKSLRPHCRGIPPKQAKQAPFLVVVGGRGWGNCAFPGLIAWLRMLHDAPVLLLHENITMNLGCYPMIFPLYLVKSIHFLMKSYKLIFESSFFSRFHPHCWRIFSTLPGWVIFTDHSFKTRFMAPTTPSTGGNGEKVWSLGIQKMLGI